MLKLAKYLKPFLPGVLMALVLLFGQAMCELYLPNLMSDIVNVGIQQGGIEHAAPDAISPEGMALMTAYMPEDDRAFVTDNYTWASADDTYRARYPRMGDGVYVLNPTGRTDKRARLDAVFGQAAYTFVSRLQALAQASGQEIDMSAEAADGMDMQRVYQAQAMLSALPEGALAGEDGDTAGDSAISEAFTQQTGVMLARAFYAELGADTDAMQSRYILIVGAYMLLIAFLGGAATVAVSYISTRVASGSSRDLRRDLFHKVEQFSNAELDTFSSASLITRCTNDVNQMQMLVTVGLRMMCYAPIMGVGGIIMALRKSVSMSWIIALAVLVLIGLVVIMVSLAMPRFKIIQTLIDNMNRVARENLSGLMVIRAFGTQAHEQARFDAANRELTRTNLFVQRVMAFMMPAIAFIMNGVTLLIVWVGANQIAHSAMQIGDMMAFMQYAMQIIMSFMMISMMFVFVPRAAVSGARIAEVLNTDISITDPEQPKPWVADQKGTVVFDHVSFRYRNAECDALADISFTAKPGQTTAIIGATGAGKTTIANLLLRFYDVTQGRITVDGVDIRAVRQADLRAKIGYVPQKGILLSGTIASNIRYGQNDASDETVAEAAAIAQASDFIAEKPEGFASEIAQGGTNVSGGQKQRLSIARALAKKPDILVFDDSFSALDFKTDAALRKALKAHIANATVIVVAQRVGTIMNADQIIVLDEGKMVGIGTHDHLMQTCPAYGEIASSQLAERAGAHGDAQVGTPDGTHSEEVVPV